MQAVTANGAKVACPSCRQSSYTIYRREVLPGQYLLNRCRCDHCSDTFYYVEDKYCRPVWDYHKTTSR
jgi:C4-type Zn-finger protein